MSFVSFEKRSSLPHIPVKGTLYLTYRCNNDCRHCWLRKSPDASLKQKELSTSEWIDFIDQARALGTREWSITGGEPMLRPDFSELFEYATAHCRRYSLNTNGTFLTAKIAKLIAAYNRGRIMVALYGATEKVHDHITRNPGSYQAALRGMRYLKEAGVRFEVQIIPMRDNLHQLEDMKQLAENISPHWRLGAVWLYLCENRNAAKNREIQEQRVSAQQVVDLETVGFGETQDQESCRVSRRGDHILHPCLENINHFSIDPYGQLSFCDFIRDPDLLYDLRRGSFKKGWQVFIPSLNDKVLAAPEYHESCGACALRNACRWCPAYAWLETGSFSKPIPYLCDIASLYKHKKEQWQQQHIRYYSIGGLTVKLESELPVTDQTFIPAIRTFESNPAAEDVYIRHSFTFPDLQRIDFGTFIHSRGPWKVYKKGETFYYFKYDEQRDSHEPVRITACNHDHSHWYIYHHDSQEYNAGELTSLSFAPNDQLILSNVIAHHQGTLVHASGFQADGRGFLVPGQSGAGKSTLTRCFAEKANILSDDRVIIRQKADRFHLYGTWKHSSIPIVGRGPFPLNVILFPVHAHDNKLVPVKNRMQFIQEILPKIVRPLTTQHWWDHTLGFLQALYEHVPAFYVHFNRTGSIVPLLLDAQEMQV